MLTLQFKFKKKHVSFIDNLLVMGIILAPMTGLRIWKIGPGEVLCLLWSVYIIFIKKETITKKNYLLVFWLIWIITIIFGCLYGMLFHPKEADPIQLTTYLFLFVIVLSIYNGFMRKSIKEIEHFLEKVFVISALWYIVLYFYSISISPTIFGAPIWFGETRFTGGGTNPHQIAALTGAMFIYGIKLLFQPKLGIGKRLIYISATGVHLYLGLQTQSSTLIAAWILALAVGLFLSISNLSRHRQRIIFRSILITVFCVLIVIFWPQVYATALNFIESDPNGLGRFEIWNSTLDGFAKSPLLGLGPGKHAWSMRVGGHFMEYHNSYIEILAMSGMIGIVNLFNFIWISYKRLAINKTFIMIFTTLLGYAVGGFVMRRLVFWTIIPILIVWANKLQSQRKERVNERSILL
jgi:O-antigen ligase